MAVDRERLFTRGDRLDPRTNARAIRLLVDALDGEPVIPLARVLEEDVVVLIPVDGAAGLNEEVDVDVAVPVAAGYALAFLKVARTGGRGDLRKPLAADVRIFRATTRRIAPASLGSSESLVRSMRSRSSTAAVVCGSEDARAFAHAGSRPPPPDSTAGSRFQAS